MTERDKNKFIEDNIGLVRFVINKDFPSNTDDEDMFQSGLIGLWQAVEKFDESLGNKFSTFAYSCIKNEIIKYWRSQTTKKSAFNNEAASLDGKRASDLEDEYTLYDVVEDPHSVYEEKLMYENLFKMKERAHIKGKEWDIFFRYFQGEKCSNLATEYKVSRQRIDQILKGVRKKLQYFYPLVVGED